MSTTRFETPARRRCAGALWLLTALFALRVAGQALQRWLPQAWLPPAEARQGSSLPYAALLALQLAIVAVMAAAAVRAWNGDLKSSATARRWLRGIGLVYLAAALARIAAGLALDDPHPWLTAWIPAAFHVVLSTYILVLAQYHALRGPARGGAAP
jgi:hypothetical protein